ncbi:hypothetical protein HYPSUDRAFT_809084 [Hypholoma sublateritium FD-334 SS-4]|uniref:Mid2 domain-containing protein n=1 Tax=Hypholoma sublateritium (strain FD-334 SS-4) TaxID=945553 RepID=A0A0D2PIE2_HYPSF|nr:hypothetical protein HYPSUDRAFT_809084 [Hypholoma sublateritium FD-334 SS-4]
MRDSWHLSRAHSLVVHWLSLRIFSLFLILLCLPSGTSGQFVNLSIPITSTQLVYTPFVCNSTVAQANPQSCSGAWRLSADEASVATTGPSPNSSNIVPQLFFQFQATDLFLTTLPSSNATVNLTASSNGTSVSTLFNTTLGMAAIVNLPENVVSQLTITFIPSNVSTQFVLQGIAITTPQNGTITSILPTQTLPPSISLPPFTTPTSGSAKRKRIAEAVGLTVGLGLGLTLLFSGTFYYWKRQRRDIHNDSIRNPHSEWTRTGV